VVHEPPLSLLQFTTADIPTKQVIICQQKCMVGFVSVYLWRSRFDFNSNAHKISNPIRIVAEITCSFGFNWPNAEMKGPK
jgi:hypothetical protein